MNCAEQNPSIDSESLPSHQRNGEPTMKTIAKLAVPAVLAFAAFSAGAQTIETDYPVVRGTGPMPTTQHMPSGSSQGALQTEPSLIQSNYEGVRENPAQAAPSRLTRAEVQREASVSVPFGALHNA